MQAAKDWGWREFVTLTSLFDIDAGFLVNDAVVFSAEVPKYASLSHLRTLTQALHVIRIGICQSVRRRAALELISPAFACISQCYIILCGSLARCWCSRRARKCGRCQCRRSH